MRNLVALIIILSILFPSAQLINPIKIHSTKNKNISIRSTNKGVFYVTPDCSFSALKHIIEIAERELYIMVYQIWHPLLDDLIIDAANRGVTVKILFEYVTIYRNLTENLAFAYNLSLNNASGRILVKMDLSKYTYYHAKVAVADGAVALVSSENFLPTSYPDSLPDYRKQPYDTPSRGFGVLIYDENIALNLQNYIEEKFSSASWYDYSPGSPPSYGGIGTYDPDFNNFTQYNIKVDLLLNPGIYQDLISLIDRANRTILIEAFYMNLNDYTVSQVIDALRRAHDERGVVVQIILEEDWDPDITPDTINTLRSYGFYVGTAFDKIGDILFLHNKAIIIDDSIIVFGSINFSDGGLNNNVEAAVVVYSTSVVQYYKSIYKHDWDASSDTPFDADSDGLSYYEETDIYGTNPSKTDYNHAIFSYPSNYSYINTTEITFRWSYFIQDKVLSAKIYQDSTFITTLDATTHTYTLSGFTDQEMHSVEIDIDSLMASKRSRVYFWVDTLPPELIINGIINNSEVDSGYISFNVSMKDLAPNKVLVYRNGLLVFQGIGVVNITLFRGNNTIKIIAFDKAGNKNESTYVVYSSKGGIGLEIYSPENSSKISDNYFNITWNATIDPDYFLIYLNDTLYLNVSGHYRTASIHVEKDGLYVVKLEAYMNGELVDSYIAYYFMDVSPPEIIFLIANGTLIYGKTVVKFIVKDFSKFTLEVYINNKRIIYRIYDRYAEREIEVSIEGFEDLVIRVETQDEFGHSSTSSLVLKSGYKSLLIGLSIGIVMIIVGLMVSIKLIKKGPQKPINKNDEKKSTDDLNLSKSDYGEEFWEL